MAFTATAMAAAAGGPPELRRRSANYQPKSWDYDSICSLQCGLDRSNRLNTLQKTLKDSVKESLLKEAEPSSRLKIIDQLQKLGVAYHFNDEIKDILMSMHVQGVHHDLKENLSSTALLFRLLREHGLPASIDILNSFKDEKGGFKKDIQKDINGLLALYEASCLAFRGETMLDEAKTFAIKSLKKFMPYMSPQQRETIEDKLDLPLHWRAPRLQAIWSLKHDNDKRWNPSILQLAKVDFDLVQTVHRGELKEITRWWKDTNLGEKLPFARDRLVESFFGATGIAFEPHLGECREIITKVGALRVHLDDIYDVYGTLDELEAFTDAIGRWDNLAAETLPDYMKVMYSAILTTSNTTADGVLKEQGYDVLALYKNGWHDLCEAFLVEAKWHHQGCKPSFEDYLCNGWITSTGPLLLLHAFPMLEEKHITSQALQQFENYPRLVQLASVIFRLCNDCATHEEESQRGDAPSSIACYMMESGCGEEAAWDAMRDIIAETWKVINEEVSESNIGWEPSFARVITSICLNLARTMHCIYRDGDGMSSPDDERKQLIRALFFEPMLISNV